MNTLGIFDTLEYPWLFMVYIHNLLFELHGMASNEMNLIYYVGKYCLLVQHNDKGKARESVESTFLPKFEWTYNTCGLHHNNSSFADYLLELLLKERNGRFLLLYKRINVDNRLLDVTGSGAIREVIPRISRLEDGEGVTENAVRSKIRRIETKFRAVRKQVYETGRG